MQSKRRLVVLEMEEVNQLQKAGKDSQQIQIGNVIINRYFNWNEPYRNKRNY